MSNQLLKSNVIDAREVFIARSYNTLKAHKLVSYITSTGYNTEYQHTQFLLTLQDGSILKFRYTTNYERAEMLFITTAIKLLRYAELNGDSPVSVLSKMLHVDTIYS